MGLPYEMHLPPLRWVFGSSLWSDHQKCIKGDAISQTSARIRHLGSLLNLFSSPAPPCKPLTKWACEGIFLTSPEMIHALYLRPKDEEPSNYCTQEVIHLNRADLKGLLPHDVCRRDQLPPTQTAVKYGTATCKWNKNCKNGIVVFSKDGQWWDYKTNIGSVSSSFFSRKPTDWELLYQRVGFLWSKPGVCVLP